MEKVIYETADAKPRNDAYTSMLFITLLSMCLGIALVAVECDEYSWESDVKAFPALNLPTINYLPDDSSGAGDKKPAEKPPKEETPPKEEKPKDEKPKDDKQPKEVTPPAGEPKSQLPKEETPKAARDSTPAVADAPVDRGPRPGTQLDLSNKALTPAIKNDSPEVDTPNSKERKNSPRPVKTKPTGGDQVPNAASQTSTPANMVPSIPLGGIPNPYSPYGALPPAAQQNPNAIQNPGQNPNAAQKTGPIQNPNAIQNPNLPQISGVPQNPGQNPNTTQNPGQNAIQNPAQNPNVPQNPATARVTSASPPRTPATQPAPQPPATYAPLNAKPVTPSTSKR